MGNSSAKPPPKQSPLLTKSEVFTQKNAIKYPVPPSSINPPLTRQQAEELYDISGLPFYYEPYKNQIIDKIITRSQELKIRFPFNELKKQAKHLCSRELFKGEKFFRDAGFNSFEEMMNSNTLSEDVKSILLESRLIGLAEMIASGFIETTKEHFIVNNQGSIIGLRSPHDKRQPQCNTFLDEGGFILSSEAVQTPEGQQRLQSMKQAPIQPILNVGQTYTQQSSKPLLGPVNQPPLNSQQANQLVDAIKFPSNLSNYRNTLVQEIVKTSSALPANKRRTFQTLLKLAADVCSTEMFTTYLFDFDKIMADYIFPESTGSAKGYKLEKQERINNRIKFIAQLLAEGEDVVLPEVYIFDKDGIRRGVSLEYKAYKPGCVKKFEKDPTAKNPSFGKVSYTPITKEQANQLVIASGFPKTLERYRNKFIDVMVKYSNKLPGNEQQDFSQLLGLAKQICTAELLTDFYKSATSRLERIEEGKTDGMFDEDNYNQLINGIFEVPSSVLVDGYIVANKEMFTFDKNGNITGFDYFQSRGRYRKCALDYEKKLNQTQPTPRPGFSERYGGKTHKHKNKKRRTLRRSKVRTNMH